MVTWSDVTRWDAGPLNEAVQTVAHRSEKLTEVRDGLDRARGRFSSEGNAATSAHNSLGDHDGTAAGLLGRLNGYNSALSGAATAVAGIQQAVTQTQSFATANGLIIDTSGNVSIGPGPRAAATAQAVSMRIPPASTPAWTKALADQATAVGMVRSVLTNANQVDASLGSNIVAASEGVETSAKGQEVPIQLMSETFDLGESGTATGDAPSLPLNEKDYWNPPKTDKEVKFERELGKDETFPPDGTKLEPNTRYEVQQGGGAKSDMSRGYYYTDADGNVTHVDANVNREEGSALNYDLREPAPNTTYRVDNVVYKTDSQSRTELAVIEDISHEIKGGRHQGIQSSVGREADLTVDGKKVLDFDGGHINAAMSGGIREEINYTPQNVDVNQSRKGVENYYALEQKWKELSPNNKVDVVIRNIYEEDVQKSTGVNSNVPTKYIVQYDVNGKDPVEVVMNNVGQ